MKRNKTDTEILESKEENNANINTDANSHEQQSTQQEQELVEGMEFMERYENEHGIGSLFLPDEPEDNDEDVDDDDEMKEAH